MRTMTTGLRYCGRRLCTCSIPPHRRPQGFARTIFARNKSERCHPPCHDAAAQALRDPQGRS